MQEDQIFLDTSVCIALLRGQVPPKAWESYRAALSSVVLAELWAGIHHQGGAKERQKVDLLLQTLDVLPFDNDAAERTGFALGTLASQGISIGDFDAQIAGHALALQIPLATLNAKHFSCIPDLELLPWE